MFCLCKFIAQKLCYSMQTADDNVFVFLRCFSLMKYQTITTFFGENEKQVVRSDQIDFINFFLTVFVSSNKEQFEDSIRIVILKQIRTLHNLTQHNTTFLPIQ